MRLNVFSAQHQVQKRMFFAIHIAERYVESALWEVAEGKLHILEQSTRYPWHREDECVHAIDRSLQELGSAEESVTQTLFALRPEWVDANGILQNRKPLFHKITKELSLQAVGFVVTTEALVQHLMQLSSPQLSLFLIDFTEGKVNVSLVQHGEIVKTERIGRSGNTVSDINEAFAHFQEKVFPSKLLLFSSFLSDDELSMAQQDLLKNSWGTIYPFLHPPLVEMFHSGQLMNIVVQTGGMAVAETRGLLKSPAIPAPSEALTKPDEFGFTEVSAPMPETAQPFTQPPVIEHRKRRGHRHLPFVLLGVMGGLLVLGALYVYVALFYAKVTVAVQLNTQTVSKDVTLTLDPKATQSDPTKFLLKASVMTKNEEEQKDAGATGTKNIGDKAKGTMTLFNLTNNVKTFPAGTQFKSGTIVFTLNQAATVASASSSLDSNNNLVTHPGTVDASVTAAQIGPDSNLPKGTNFTIDTASSTTYTARASTDLAGGSSRLAQVISQQDVDTLTATIKNDLLAKAQQDFRSQTPPGEFTFPSGKVKILKTALSAPVGTETQSFTIDLSMSVDGLTYQQSDLKPLVTQILGAQVPSGYQLANTEPQILSSPLPAASGSAQTQLQTNLSMPTNPVIDTDSWKKAIAGKSEKGAIKILQAQSAIKSVTITFSPTIFKTFFGIVPNSTQHIEIITQ